MDIHVFLALIPFSDVPDNNVHGANMLAPWTLLSGIEH